MRSSVSQRRSPPHIEDAGTIGFAQNRAGVALESLPRHRLSEGDGLVEVVNNYFTASSREDEEFMGEYIRCSLPIWL